MPRLFHGPFGADPLCGRFRINSHDPVENTSKSGANISPPGSQMAAEAARPVIGIWTSRVPIFLFFIMADAWS